MATISGSRSRPWISHRFRDLCCDLQAQGNASSLLKCLLFTLPALAVLAAGVLLVLRFAVTPQIKAYVQDARLTSLAPAGERAYNISVSVALTVRNLNGAMAIKYTKPLVATFLFDDRRLYNVTVADEGYEHKPLKRVLHLLRTGGGEGILLDAASDEEFKEQNVTGVIKVEMRLYGEITLGIGNNRELELSCPLALQRRPPGPDDVLFHEVDCEPDKPKKIIF